MNGAVPDFLLGGAALIIFCVVIYDIFSGKDRP